MKILFIKNQNKFQQLIFEHFEKDFEFTTKILNLSTINQTDIKNANIVFCDEKSLETINPKAINPCLILVVFTSALNFNNFSETINFCLLNKINLCFKIFEDNTFEIVDPLGNFLYSGNKISRCITKLKNRLILLSSVKRVKTTSIDQIVEIPNKPGFFNIVKKWGKLFHTIINPNQQTRYVGNASFRCQKGFPSFRHGNLIFVSKRNIDKRFITKENFVATFLDKQNNVFYYGNQKPSVDTPISLLLYKNLPKINYIIHSHTYIKNAPTTSLALPCGAINEFDEIMKLITDKNKTFYAINLINHGCIVMSKNISNFNKIEFISRKMPEFIK